MNTPRSWFPIRGLLFCLLLGAGAYFLLSAKRSVNVALNTPTAVTKVPVLIAASERGLTVPTSDAASSSQAQAGSVTTPAYQYNAQGQIQAIIYPDGSVYTYQYDAYGDKIKETSGTGKTWSYVYDQSHHSIAVIDPEGRVTHKEASLSPSNAQ